MRVLIAAIFSLIPTSLHAQISSHQMGPGRVGASIDQGESERDRIHRMVRERDARQAVEDAKEEQRVRRMRLHDEKMARWRAYQRQSRNSVTLHSDGTKTRGASWEAFERSERYNGN